MFVPFFNINSVERIVEGDDKMGCCFEGIEIGEHITVTFTGTAVCMACNGDLHGLKTSGVYGGHQTRGNVYDVVYDCDLICPHCHSHKTQYLNICDKGGSWLLESFKVESVEMY